MAIAPSDVKQANDGDHRCILAHMFTKRQTAETDDDWVFGYSGNC
jgi:hypothetical protein